MLGPSSASFPGTVAGNQFRSGTAGPQTSPLPVVYAIKPALRGCFLKPSEALQGPFGKQGQWQDTAGSGVGQFCLNGRLRAPVLFRKLAW